MKTLWKILQRLFHTYDADCWMGIYDHMGVEAHWEGYRRQPVRWTHTYMKLTARHPARFRVAGGPVVITQCRFFYPNGTESPLTELSAPQHADTGDIINVHCTRTIEEVRMYTPVEERNLLNAN